MIIKKYGKNVDTTFNKEAVMRLSENEFKESQLRNGFNYDLQVWVKDYIICPLNEAKRLGIDGKDIRDVLKKESNAASH